jgi:hypothetical protein
MLDERRLADEGLKVRSAHKVVGRSVYFAFSGRSGRVCIGRRGSKERQMCFVNRAFEGVGTGGQTGKGERRRRKGTDGRRRSRTCLGTRRRAS